MHADYNMGPMFRQLQGVDQQWIVKKKVFLPKFSKNNPFRSPR